MKRVLLLLAIFIVTNFFALSLAYETKDDLKSRLLTYVKEHIQKETNNSEIIEVPDPDSGFARWFEVYGILSRVEKVEGNYVVYVDVNELGNESQSYLVGYFIKEKDDSFEITDVRLGRSYQRTRQPAPDAGMQIPSEQVIQ